MDWLTPTRRAVRWAPLAVTTAASAATLTIVHLVDRPLRGDLLLWMLSMIVLGALCGLQDPARDFVQAMPVSAAHRLVHRLAVLVPPLVLGVLGVRILVGALFEVVPSAPGSTALAAFGATGVAACAVLARWIGPRAADAAVSAMLAWLALGVTVLGLDAPLGVAFPWWRFPLLVCAGAVVVTWIATTRGAEA